MNRPLLAALVVATTLLTATLALAQEERPAPAEAPKAAAPVVEYEYKTVRSNDKFGAGPFRSSDSVEQFLNAEAAKGWRLVAADDSMLYLERIKR